MNNPTTATLSPVDELIHYILSMTPEQTDRFLNHPEAQRIMSKYRRLNEFAPEAVNRTRRIIDNMYSNDMIDARDIYQTAAAILDIERDDSDPAWNEAIAITAVYLTGREAGIRSERQKKKATDGNQ